MSLSLYKAFVQSLLKTSNAHRLLSKCAVESAAKHDDDEEEVAKWWWGKKDSPRRMGKICARVYARFLFDRQSQRNQIIYTYLVLCVYMFAYVNVHMMRTRRTKKNATFTHSHSEHLCVCVHKQRSLAWSEESARSKTRVHTHTLTLTRTTNHSTAPSENFWYTIDVVSTYRRRLSSSLCSPVAYIHITAMYMLVLPACVHSAIYTNPI